jgi:Tol biopolymer transport system component
MYPRFAPDGETIAFVAVTDTLPSTGNRLQSVGTGGFRLGRHGVPWDVWLARVDGSSMQNLRSGEDDPSIAWSADGSELAIYGGQGLIAVGRNGIARTVNTDVMGWGGIDWSR